MPGSNSLFHEFKGLYGPSVLSQLRKYVDLRRSIVRHKMHLFFNHRCLSDNVLPRSLRFRSPHNSAAGKKIMWKCGMAFIRLRIGLSHHRIRECSELSEELLLRLAAILSHHHMCRFELYVKSGNEALQRQLTINTERHLCSIVPKRQEAVNATGQLQKKNWVVNLSSYQPNEVELKVLQLGTNFAVAPRTVPKASMLACVEKGIYSLPLHVKNLIQSKLVNCIKSHRGNPCNLTTSERRAVTDLKANDDITILPADKGNSTVILDRKVYEDKIHELLHDSSTYKKLPRDPTRRTEQVLNKFVGVLHKEKNCISDAMFHHLHSTDGSAPRLYGLPKVHKKNVPLRPIVSFIGSPTYNLAKYLARILAPLIGNTEFTVRNSAEFVKSLNAQQSLSEDETLVSFDVTSLFTNVPIDLALEITKSRLLDDYSFKDRTTWTHEDIHRGLEICLQQTYFRFRGSFYKQMYGTAMGSPVSVAVANMVMESVEERALQTFDKPPRFWRRYVDDTFCIIHKHRVTEFLRHLNNVQRGIAFTMELESKNRLPFLDVEILKAADGKLSTRVYHKPTSTMRYLHFTSHHPLYQKRAVVKALKDQARRLTTDPALLQAELHRVNEALRLNGYPNWILRDHKKISRKEIQYKERAFVTLPYIPRLTDIIRRMLTDFGVSVGIKPANTLRQMLSHPKDPLDATATRGVVYAIPCGECDEIYIGETGRSLNTRRKEHERDVGKKDAKKSALANHATTHHHSINFSAAQVLVKETDFHKRSFLESWNIHSRANTMNVKTDVLMPINYRSLLHH